MLATDASDAALDAVADTLALGIGGSGSSETGTALADGNVASILTRTGRIRGFLQLIIALLVNGLALGLLLLHRFLYGVRGLTLAFQVVRVVFLDIC